MDVEPSNDPVHDWVHQEIPQKLWHYTSMQGFQGILASGEIYATDVRFLNDAEEFVHALKIANELTAQTPEFGDYQFPMRRTLQSAVEMIFKSEFLDPNRAQIFVASFTDSEDDLSQWRAYSHGTHGASIAFDLRWIRPPIETGSEVSFAPCVYHEKEKRELIQSALQHFVRVSQSRWADLVKGALREFVSGGKRPEQGKIAKATGAVFVSDEFQAELSSGLIEARKRVFRLAGLLKHRAFVHEREWRLVLPLSPGKDKSNLIHPIRFRAGNASLIPYLEFPLYPFSMRQTPEAPATPALPVSDVMLGPGASERALGAAAEFLRSRSINAIPRLSDVPYRQV